MVDFRTMPKVDDIRRLIADLRPDEQGMLELICRPFIADEPAVFGTPNNDWHNRELEWYLSQSRNVYDIKEPIPEIWKQVAAKDGTINSNYGWCIFSEENGHQFWNAIKELRSKPHSRQATMIYTRPTMHTEAKENGRYDFMCTNTVQLFIRQGFLHYIVNMRSSDAVFGYKGDYAWHDWVFNDVLRCLPHVRRGYMLWNANSFHVYPRHHHIVRKWDDDDWENN